MLKTTGGQSDQSPADCPSAVGARLRGIRQSLEISQLSASQELRISRAQLANYEDARTPLRVEVALDACCKFLFSEKWLATGEGDKRQLMNLRDDPVARKVRRGTFYGIAYREVFAARYEQLLSEDPDGIRFPANDLAARYSDPQGIYEEAWGLLLNEDERVELSRLLTELGNRYCAKKAKFSAFNFSEGSSLADCDAILAAKQILKLKRKMRVQK